ncbi:hypothetical protein BSL82_05700 [Tardibacter chloracetimidivorans]|uniref:Phage gp6-like head-tail connector protein n=1 Tax=Tardibacter chloracetimidivorans TaxID=1921510 RepID=A0A1L3ZTB6_9SPHN|nr:hypothetical protein [Tardibacter chloracetimidivorans]API58867.1 hypothetical protein BSL82_05700 [Tardibacter chloracetimidivorans]
MNEELVQLTAPTDTISVDEAAAMLRMDTTDADPLLAGHLLAAREMLESDTGRLFGSRTLRWTIDAWPSCAGELTIPRAPVTAVTSVKYDDADGVEQTLATDDYLVRQRHGLTRITLAAGKSWPTLGDDGQVRIAFTAGESPISEIARRAIVQLAAFWFDNPIGAVSEGYTSMMTRLRVRWL